MSVDVFAAKHCWYIKNLYTVEQVLLFPSDPNGTRPGSERILSKIVRGAIKPFLKKYNLS